MKLSHIAGSLVLAMFVPFCSLAASSNCLVLQGIPGITKAGDPPLVFRSSQFDRKLYGVHQGFFYGDWSWNIDFNLVGIPASPRGNEEIAAYAARCYTSYPMGRIHYGILEKRLGESQKAYLQRVFDDLVEAKRELLVIQQSLNEKLGAHLPPGMDPAYREIYQENMQNHIMSAQLQLVQFIDTQLLYTIEGMGNYTKMQGKISNDLANIIEFISFIGDVPDSDRWARDLLVENTNDVLSTYGLFFGEDQKEELKKILDQSLNVDTGKDLKTVKEELEVWVAELQKSLQNAFDAESAYFLIAIKLKFLFGTRDPANQIVANAELLNRLGDSGMDEKFKKLIEGIPNDPALWEGIRRDQ